ALDEMFVGCSWRALGCERNRVGETGAYARRTHVQGPGGARAKGRAGRFRLAAARHRRRQRRRRGEHRGRGRGRRTRAVGRRGPREVIDVYVGALEAYGFEERLTKLESAANR